MKAFQLIFTLLFTSTFAIGQTSSDISVSASATEGCEPLAVNFTLNNVADPGANIVWNIDELEAVKGGTAMRHSFDAGNHHVKVQVTINGKTTVHQLDEAIKVLPSPVAGFEVSAPPYFAKEKIALKNTSIGDLKYDWDFGGQASKSGKSLNYDFDSAGVYNVQLLAIAENGCTNEVSKKITVGKPYSLLVPNVFCPGCCGSSDLFRIVWIDPMPESKDYSLFMFNRWGELMFESNDPTAHWDGMYKGQLLSDDVYVWKINFLDPTTQEPHELYGHVTVMR
jgi:gliding motility-associated-like protein